MKARKTKIGLDYFPLDIEMFEDDKIVMAQQIIGAADTNVYHKFMVPYIAIRILRDIYKEGYCMAWNPSVCLKMANNFSVLSTKYIENVILSLLQSGFFSMDIFVKYGILTSAGIQKRWLHAVKNGNRSKNSVETHLDLINPAKNIESDEEHITELSSLTNCGNSPTNSAFSPTNSENSPTNSAFSTDCLQDHFILYSITSLLSTNNTISVPKNEISPTKSPISPTNSENSPTNSAFSPTKSENSPTNSAFSPTNSLNDTSNSTKTGKKDENEKKGKNEKKEADLEKIKKDFGLTLKPFEEQYGFQMLTDFYRYWIEPSHSGKRLRFQAENFWDLSRRLATWHGKDLEARKASQNAKEPTSRLVDAKEILKQRGL